MTDREQRRQAILETVFAEGRDWQGNKYSGVVHRSIIDRALSALAALEKPIDKVPAREDIKAELRAIRFEKHGYIDPFCAYQDGKISKGYLLDIISNALFGKVPVREVTEDEIGFEVYKILTHYSPEDAKETWTGKHYQSKQKCIASSIAQVLLAKLNLPERKV